MRNAFAGDITNYAFHDDDIMILSGDVGNKLFNVYKELQPDQFMNCGVAEANMTSMAGGMALSGMRPFTYSITPFNTTRCIEQIRVDLCYHNVPATIVAVGGGFSYAGCGATHHSCEDIAMLRALPNLKVLCPGDALEVRALLPEILDQQSPVYFRLGKKNEPVIHNEVPDLEIGRAIEMKSGDDVCLLNTGITLPETLKAAENLDEHGISTAVVQMHTVKPLDEDCLENVFEQYDLVASVEEHSRIGGFGGAVSEWLGSRNGEMAPLIRIGTPDEFLHETGSQDYAREQMGISADRITEKIKSEAPTLA